MRGVLADQRVVAHQFQIFLRCRGTLRRAEMVLAAQALQKALQRLGQGFIRGSQIGPLRIATIGWNRHAAQNRGGRRVVGRRSRQRASPSTGAALPDRCTLALRCLAMERAWIAIDMAKDRVAWR